MQYSRLGCSMAKIGNNLVRQFHRSNCLRMNPKNVEEIKIPVPWGHIAGLWFGNQNETPIIGLHGFQENAASFIPLLQLMNVSSVLCIDMPGQGQSSHLAPGITQHFFDNIIFLRYLLNKHFKFNSDLTILGHSFGAAMGFVYSALFPSEVSRLISIDSALFNIMRKQEKFVHDTRKTIDRYLEWEGKTREPQTFDEMLGRIRDTRIRNFPLSDEGYKILLSRGLTPVGDKYIVSCDPRLSIRYLGNMSEEFIFELSSRLKCKMLNIRADRGLPKGEELEVCMQSLDIIKKHNKHILDIMVSGGHHVHLEQPENVAGVINKYLSET